MYVYTMTIYDNFVLCKESEMTFKSSSLDSKIWTFEWWGYFFTIDIAHLNILLWRGRTETSFCAQNYEQHVYYHAGQTFMSGGGGQSSTNDKLETTLQEPQVLT